MFLVTGVIIFIVLTVVTIAARPAPLRLAGEHLTSLEGRIVHSASDLWRVGQNLQSSLRGAGGQASKSSLANQLFTTLAELAPQCSCCLRCKSLHVTMFDANSLK